MSLFAARFALLAGLLVAACGRDPPLTAELTNLRGEVPRGEVGAPYRATLTLSTPSRTIPSVEVIEGALPRGLGFRSSSTDRIELVGTPLEAGLFDVAIAVRVSTPALTILTESLVIEVAEITTVTPLRLATDRLPDAAAGEPYASSLTASGGAAPYTFARLTPLPPGLVLDPSGEVRGVPSRVGDGPFTAQVRDQLGQLTSGRVQLTVVANDRPRLVPVILPVGRLARPYSATLRGSGGDSGPYRWNVVQDRLPRGLSFRLRTGSSVEITGIPTEVGSRSFMVELTDGRGATGAGALTIEIVGALSLEQRGELPPGRLRVAYSTAIPVRNGLAPLSVQLVSGSLPPGIQATPEEDAIRLQGTPINTGVFRFNLLVRDRLDAVAATYRLQIAF